VKERGKKAKPEPTRKPSEMSGAKHPEKPQITERAGVEEPIIVERELQPTRRSSFATIGDAAITIDGTVTRNKIRLSHLRRRGETCPDTVKILEAAEVYHTFVDGMLAERLQEHVVWPYVSHIKGFGLENIAKVIARIENFGRYYDVGDRMIPYYVTREPEEYLVLKGETLETKTGIWVSGIERLTMPSKLRKLAGHVPGMKREKGKKVMYDQTLKMLTWRLGGGLMRAQGKFYEFYEVYRQQIEAKFAADGVKIIPTPKGRRCPDCDKEWELKAALYCPDCGGTLTLKKEGPGTIFQGHVHNRAAARMRQMFLDSLWAAWRELEGLPVTTPYVQSVLQHQDIIPWRSWMDK